MKKYKSEVASSGMMVIPSFMKICDFVQYFLGGMDTWTWQA
jgi:hypothetical protein